MPMPLTNPVVVPPTEEVQYTLMQLTHLEITAADPNGKVRVTASCCPMREVTVDGKTRRKLQPGGTRKVDIDDLYASDLAENPVFADVMTKLLTLVRTKAGL